MAQILVVEDDEDLRELYCQILALGGHEVSSAPCGESGLRQFREAPAELVVTDLLMPNKDGIELLTQIRRETPETKIVALSGGGRIQAEFYLGVAEKLGAKVLRKPVRREDLLAAVDEVLAS